MGPRARPQRLHRGCASAEQPRSGRHPCAQWDLARGLRGRVAERSTSDGRRRPDQPLRAVRRGRPRRRAREVRRTQPAGTAAGKRGKPGARALSAYFAARDWDAMAEMLADDYSSDDRRRVVDAGVRHGRDAEIADMRAIADIGITNVTSTVIATRGERLALTRVRFSGHDQRTRGVPHRGARHRRDRRRRADRRRSSSFDLDDIDAAFAELDARYLAGEAAAHAHTWSVIARGLRRAQPTRAAADHAGLGEHRPPPRGSVRARRRERIHPRRVGHSARTSAPTSRLCIG